MQNLERKWLGGRTKGKSTSEEGPAAALDQDREIAADERPFLHANVGYKVEGHADLTESTLKVFSWVKEHYSIPADFNTDHKFGALSGISFEERVISAYQFNLIQPKDPDAKQVKIKEVEALWTMKQM